MSEAKETSTFKKILVDLDKYEKQDKIGSGGFSKVFKICEKKSRKIYSAKILLKPLASNSTQEIRDFFNEIYILSTFNHPLLLHLIGISARNFKQKPKPVIVTEYCTNGSLDDVIKIKQFSDTQKFIFVFGIAAAMSYLHSKNIIHCDLKPNNVLTDDSLHPKISDFGLSFIIPENSSGMVFKESRINGTPAYIAPEIWNDYKYSKSSDVYAFSFIVYEIMTNEKPLTEFTEIIQILIKVVRNGYRPKLTEQIPPSYRTLIEECWNEDPEKRPTFSDIKNRMKSDSGFFTEKMNRREIAKFIESISDWEEQDGQKSKPDQTNKGVQSKFHEFLSSIASFFKQSASSLDDEEEFEQNSRISIFDILSIMTLGDHTSINAGVGGVIIGSSLGRGKDKNKKKVSSSSDNDFDIDESELQLFIRPDVNEDVPSLEEKAQNGDVDAMMQLGEKYYNGNLVQTDIEKAKEYYKMAANLGNTDAMNNYAWILFENRKSPDDLTESKAYLEQAANKGNMTAMRNYLKLIDQI